MIDFSNDWQNNQSSSSASPLKGESEAEMKQQWTMNRFLVNVQ